ncbi:MAG: hypothetical protein LBH90_10295 [Tannerella sp.]|jgi:hypothetical protein|nr:hypothetical protein [Tannerella sp.]
MENKDFFGNIAISTKVAKNPPPEDFEKLVDKKRLDRWKESAGILSQNVHFNINS